VAKKIAPTLRWLVDTATYDQVKTNWARADRELRALLAVAGAARGLIEVLDASGLVSQLPSRRNVRRSLARLDRASGGGK
jgi:hypothetical protein